MGEKIEADVVSIVIPIYNSEDFLHTCVDSVINQTYKNIEIILIDDGSKDSSRYICESYKKHDHRIKFLYHRNMGVSATRNRGIDVATGKYIIFIDSDDICKSDMIEQLVKCANENPLSSLIICGIAVFDDKIAVIEQINNESCNVTVQEYIKNILVTTQIGQFCGGPYNKLFVLDLIKKNKLRFREGMNYAEDFCFNMQYLKVIRNISIINDSLYLYRKNRINSLTYRNYNNIDIELYWKHRLYTYQIFESVFKHYQLFSEYKSEVESLLKKFMISSIKMACKISNRQEDTIAFIKALLENEYCHERLKGVFKQSFFDNLRLLFIKNNYAVALYYFETLRYKIAGIVKKL